MSPARALARLTAMVLMPGLAFVEAVLEEVGELSAAGWEWPR